MEILGPIMLLGIIFGPILYLWIVRPFLEGMREGRANPRTANAAFPEECPMCGAETLMTRELRCVHCGENLAAEKPHQESEDTGGGREIGRIVAIVGAIVAAGLSLPIVGWALVRPSGPTVLDWVVFGGLMAMVAALGATPGILIMAVAKSRRERGKGK